MKRYYCFLALFALLGLGSAQAQITTFPYTQGFESGLGGWTTVDGDNDGENWFSSTGSDEDIIPHGGSSYASSWSYDHVYYDSWNPDNYLISPAITVTSGLNLSYYVIRGCHSGYPDQYSLYVSTSATPSDINALTPLVTESPTETQWTKKTFSLENYAGQTVYIVFRHHNSYDMCSIGIDDVTIGEAGMPEVMLPGPLTASIGTPLNIGASVVGAQPLTLTWSSVMASNGDATMYDNGDTLTITYSASGLDTVMLIASNSLGADTATTVVNAYCVAPTSITTTSSSIDSALFSWTGQATDYEYALMVGSAEPGEYDIFTTTDNSVLYDTLQGGVTYTFYVRALCGTSHSTWITKQHTPGTYILAANSSDTLRTCGSVIYDDGGPNGSYASSQNTTLYILPTDDTKWVVISGSSYTEGNYDYIRIYDGMGTSGEQLFTDYGIDANTSFGPFMCPAGATLTFYSDGSVTRSGFQINVTCIDAPTCLAPTNLTLVRAAEDTLVVSWNAPEGGASDYMVQYRSGSDEWSSLTVSDTVAAIDGLSANTVYEVVVRTLCGSDSSFAISGTYRTACGAITTLPWTESFETFDSGTRDTAVTCWNFIWPTGGSSNGYCQVVNSYAVTGSNTLRFSGYASTPMTAILPPFTDDISGLEMSFYLRAENSNAYSGTTNSPGAIRVGYITSIGDSTTFVQTARFECTSGNYGSMAMEAVTFAGAPSGARIAIQQVNNGTNYWWWIDDIDVHIAPSCTRPTIAVSDVTTDGATLTLNDASEVGNYRLVVVSGSNSDTIDNVTSPYILTGLASGSAYTVYAYTVCDDGTYTAPSTASFFTACDVVSTFPWSENFDARTTGTFNDPCWENVHISGNGSSLFSVSSSSQGGNSTNKLQLPDMSSGTMTKLALPPMQFEDGTAYLFSIDVYRNTSSYPNEGVRIFVNDTNDFAGAVELGFLHRNYQQTDGRVVTAESASGWYTYEFLIPDTIESPVYIILRGESSYGSSTYMDNISVAVAPSCMRPASIDVTSVDSTSVTLAINDANNTGNYHIVILSGNDTVVNETIASNTYTNDTLQPATLYTVLVSTLCDDGTETATTSTSFNTSCTAIATPWTESFDTYSTTDFAANLPCWVQVTPAIGTSVNYVNLSTSYPYNGSRHLRFAYSDPAGCIVALPMFDNDISTLELSFMHRPESATNSSCGTLRVGYITNIADTSTFVAVSQWNYNDFASDTYRQEDITFAGAPAGARIAFSHSTPSTNNWYWFIDSIDVHAAPSCLRPVSVTVSDITETSALVAINDPTHANSYSLVVVNGSDTAVNTTLTDTSYTLTGLQAATAYTVIVRTLCDDGTMTNPVTTSFNTSCGAVTAPWLEDFNSAATWMCWTTYSFDNETNSDWTLNDGEATSSYNADAAANDWLITPAIEVPSDADGLALTWKATGVSYDGYNTHLTVRLSTTSTDTASFSTVLFNNDLPDAWNSYSASLDSYAGETIYVAFIHDSYNDDGPSIDSVQVRSTLVPVVSIVADATTADAGTNLGFRAVLSEGSTTGINYTWTNTLAASTISGSGDSINIAYTVAGEDTVTVIVTNSYGADTASVFVRVRDCQVVSVFPWTVDFENSDDIECWSQEGSSQWRIGTGDNNSSTGAHGGTGNVLITHSSTGNVTKLITPVLNLGGASSATLTFWHIQRVWAGDQDELNVYYRTSQSDPWTLITSYTSNIATWTADTLTLPNTTATYQVAFEMVDDWGYGVAIDDITISGANGPQTSFVVSATSANATMGTATVSPNGTVAAGTSVTATATANEGYQFVNWTVSGNVVSSANPYTFTVTANTALVANFEALPEPDCETPTNVTVSDVTLTSATIAWTAGEGQNNWDVHVTGIGYDQTFTTSTNPYTVTGLNADVVYTVTVRANCSATAFSEWSAPVTFTTFSCQSVSGVNVSNVTTNSAQVSWTAVQGVNGYEVEYGASGFNQGAGTTVQASTNNATLTGLTANMAYDVYVRSVCGEGVYSAWSNVTSFTTDEGEGIDDVNSAAIALYPNPATTTVTISGIEGQATVTIVDMNGRVSGEWRVENDEITIDLTGYAQGAYFVRITGEQQNAIRKLIVK